MRVAVTGATGYVGAHAAARLLSGDHKLRLLVRDPARVDVTLGRLVPDVRDRVELIVGDMTDGAAARELVDGADAVIHAAAIVAPLDRKGAATTVRVNVEGAAAVLGAAASAGCRRIVHVSSLAALRADGARIVTTDLPPHDTAANPYSLSKGLAEALARQLQAEGHPVTIVYPGGALGPPAGIAFGDAAEGYVSMVKSGVVVVRNAGMPLVDVRDLAEVLERCLHTESRVDRFLAGGRLVRMPEIAAALRTLTGRRFPLLPVPGAALRTAGRLLDGIRQVVDFQTVFTAEAMHVLTKPVPTDDSAVHDVLGVQYRPVIDTIEAALRGLHAAGRLTAPQVGALADGQVAP